MADDGVDPGGINPPDTQLLDRRIAAELDRRGLSTDAETATQGPGGGGGDGLEPRLAKVEAAVEHIEKDIGEIKTELRTLRDNARTDFRMIFGAIIALALGLAGLMAHGFHWL